MSVTSEKIGLTWLAGIPAARVSRVGDPHTRTPACLITWLRHAISGFASIGCAKYGRSIRRQKNSVRVALQADPQKSGC